MVRHEPDVPELPHRLDDRQQGQTLVRQLVLDPRGRLGVAPAQEDLLVLEDAEPLGEGARADPRACALELGEASRPFGKVV